VPLRANEHLDALPGTTHTSACISAFLRKRIGIGRGPLTGTLSSSVVMTHGHHEPNPGYNVRAGQRIGSNGDASGAA